MKILSVAGARPNFIKLAPLHRAFCQHPEFDPKIVHTGQHYDYFMSGVFFEQLGLPEPDYFLGAGSGSHAVQTAGIMVEFEKVMLAEKPDLLVVIGDVNSTLACALVAAKAGVPVAHVEAGLRSGDRTMPEEINRILTDQLADHLFVTEQTAFDNLLRENIPASRIHFVGNVLIDSLVHCRPALAETSERDQGYILLTMHRPVNVDSRIGLMKILDLIIELSKLRSVKFPLHPRTTKNIAECGLEKQFEDLSDTQLLPPQDYFSFLMLIKGAALVITDSGGVQEETTFLQIPCITLRNTTERPVTVLEGTNYLLPDFTPELVVTLARHILLHGGKVGNIPKLWDGNAAQRIAAILKEKYINS